MMSPRVRVASVFVGTAAYLGLAVAGWGGAGPFFAHPPLVALAVALVAMSIVALFAGGNLSAGLREDRGNRWVLVVFGAIGLLLGFVPAWSDRREFWTLDGDTVRWAGLALFVIGGGLRLWPVFVLGDRFSGLVAIQPGHTLVTDGIYRRIRNPSYLGLLVNSLGWSLAFRSAPGVLLTALLLVPLVARMNAEERLLRAQFGAEYDAYCRRSARLLPGIY